MVPVVPHAGARVTNIPLEGQTNDLTERETVHVVWPADEDEVGYAAWRIRQDDYGYWLDRRPEGCWAWGIFRKIDKKAALRIVAERAGGQMSLGAS